MNLTHGDLLEIVRNIQYLDWDIFVDEMGHGWYIQWRFYAPDSATNEMQYQHARKWYISPWMTKTEVVDTVFKALEAAVKHEMEHNFKYRGRAIRNPHIDCEARWEMCEQTEHRAGVPV